MTNPEATGTARYHPGSWVAIVSPVSWLLADLDPRSPVVPRCYELIVSGAPAEDVLDAIVSMGLRVVPSFAFVSAAPGALVLRGSARASVLNADASSRDFDSSSTTTWAEHRLVAEPAAFRLIGGAAGDVSVELPLSDGVTMASSLTIHSQSPAGRQAFRSQMPIGGRPGAGAGPPQHPPAAAGPQHASPRPMPHPDAAQVAPAQPVANTLSPEETGKAEVDTGAALIDSLPWVQKPVVPGAGTPPATANFDPPAPPAAAQPPPAAVQPPTVHEGDSGTEATMGRSLLRALIAAQDPSPVQGPTVHAVHCANGHLNPAHASVCRACGAPVLAEAPLIVPRPVLGALRLSTGDVIPLDRGVLLGRHPKGSAAGPDAERHVVRVPSPNGDISRAHTEIRLDGWHVLAVDLNSTNGTVVVPPGRAPERLRPNEARPIEPGTVVLLSDDVSFRFEVEP
jgi:hypothetical protein